MRKPYLLLLIALAAPAAAKPHSPDHGTRQHADRRAYEQCLEDQRQAQKKGTIVGAAGAGAATAIFGGNLGQTALVAGGGALTGRAIGKGSKKC